jgi:hypothetical protein
MQPGAFAKGTAAVEAGFLFVWDTASRVLQRLRRGKQTRGFSDGLCKPPPLFSLGGRGGWPLL